MASGSQECGATLQCLVDVARRTAAEGLSAEADSEICRLMDALTAKGLCLDVPYATRQQSGEQIIWTQSVVECPAFELVIFVFPAEASIPLHDHPGMTVFSKVLYGKLSMISYDWEQPLTPEELVDQTRELDRLEGRLPANTRHTSPPLSPPRRANRRADTVLTPEAPTFALRPRFANIHAFTALGATAVLDLLLPPYDEDAGRDCHYFASIDACGGERVTLQVAAPPESLIIKRATYRGPAVLSSATGVGASHGEAAT